MRAKSIFMKQLGAVALAAGIVFGALAVNTQPISAAAKFKVADKKYEKTYKQDDGQVYFEAKGVFPEIKSNSKAAKKTSFQFCDYNTYNYNSLILVTILQQIHICHQIQRQEHNAANFYRF